MQRRELLISVGGAVALSGCTGGESDESPTETVTPSTTVLAFGETAPDTSPAITVTDIEATTIFYDTYQKKQRVWMPDDEQLVLLSVSLTNQSETDVARNYTNAFELVDGEAEYTSTGGFPHPAYDGAVDFDWLERKEDTERLGVIEDPLEPGETRSYWVGYVTPRHVDVNALAVGFGSLPEAEYRYLWEQ